MIERDRQLYVLCVGAFRQQARGILKDRIQVEISMATYAITATAIERITSAIS